MKIGIIKEFKTPSDKRVVFTPSKCAAAKKLFPKVEFLIESSDVRCYSDKEYSDLGFKELFLLLLSVWLQKNFFQKLNF